MTDGYIFRLMSLIGTQTDSAYKNYKGYKNSNGKAPLVLLSEATMGLSMFSRDCDNLKSLYNIWKPLLDEWKDKGYLQYNLTVYKGEDGYSSLRIGDKGFLFSFFEGEDSFSESVEKTDVISKMVEDSTTLLQVMVGKDVPYFCLVLPITTNYENFVGHIRQKYVSAKGKLTTKCNSLDISMFSNAFSCLLTGVKAGTVVDQITVKSSGNYFVSVQFNDFRFEVDLYNKKINSFNGLSVYKDNDTSGLGLGFDNPLVYKVYDFIRTLGSAGEKLNTISWKSTVGVPVCDYHRLTDGYYCISLYNTGERDVVLKSD